MTASKHHPFAPVVESPRARPPPLLGVVDRADGRLAYVNAGHPPPFVAATHGVATVLRDATERPPSTITLQLRTAVRDHARRQRDDVTILVARRT